MARVCEVTGKGPMVGNNVSHANNKTKRRFLPNLQETKLLSDTLGQQIRLKLTTHAIRSIEHNGGLDAYLTKHSSLKLTPEAAKLKRQIERKLSKKAA